MKFLIQAVVLFTLIGCSALEQTHDVSITKVEMVRGTEGALPEKFQLHDVPHNPRKQKGTDCAADSLRMILNYRGQNIADDQDITQKVTDRGRTGGITFNQLQRIAVEHYDLPAFIIHNCDLNSLKSAIVNRWAPIISYKTGNRSYHAVVAVGYDDKRHTMLIHDPNYLRIKKIRYDDLGGSSEDSIQRLSCLLILPEGSTEAELRRGLKKYVSDELVKKLNISARLPLQKVDI